MQEFGPRVAQSGYDSLSLDDKAKPFRRDESDLPSSNTAYQELVLVYNLFLALLANAQYKSEVDEANSLVWKRLLKSGNIFRTKRKFSPVSEYLKHLMQRLQLLIEQPNVHITMPSTDGKGENITGPAYEVIARTTLMAAQVFYTLLHDPNPKGALEESEEISANFSEIIDEIPENLDRSLAETVSHFGFVGNEATQILASDFIGLVVEVCEATIRNPNAIVRRPPSHLFSKNFFLKTPYMAHAVCIKNSKGAPEIVYAGKGDACIYFFAGVKDTMAKLYTAMPKLMLKILNKVHPQFPEIFRLYTGEDLTEFLSRKDNSTPRAQLERELSLLMAKVRSSKGI